LDSAFLRDFSRRFFICIFSLMFGMGMMICLIALNARLEQKNNFQIKLAKTSVKTADKITVKKEFAKKTEKKKKRKKSEAMIIADEIVRLAATKDIKKRLNHKVFSDDFFVALQFQESRACEKAVSSKGAKGRFQVTPIAVQAVVEYLDCLKTQEKLDYRGPGKISSAMAKQIVDLFAKNPRYDEANSKLYFLSIHDAESPYNQKPNRNVFHGKSIKEQQRLALYCYLGGPELRLNPRRVEASGRQYVKNIFGFMKTSKKIRKNIKEIYNYQGNDVDELIISVMREMEVSNQDPRNYASLDKKIIKRKIG